MFVTAIPLSLLLVYMIVLIPLLAVWMLRDFAIKNDGYFAWHRNSLVILAQRLLFCILTFTAVLVLGGCLDSRKHDPGHCVQVALWPLMVPLGVVTLKVVCLRDERLFLWVGFAVCLLAQMISLSVVEYTRETAKARVWLIFCPLMLFGVLIDVECLWQAWSYKPVAFRTVLKYAKEIMVSIAVASLVSSILLIVYSYLAFAEDAGGKRAAEQAFILMLYLKGVTWSPFIAGEVYDTLFENIYTDVQHQLNPVNPKKASMTRANVRHYAEEETEENEVESPLVNNSSSFKIEEEEIQVEDIDQLLE